MTNQPTPAGGGKDYTKAARDFVIESLDPYFDSEQLTVIWGELEIEDLLRRSDELAQVKAENEALRSDLKRAREESDGAIQYEIKAVRERNDLRERVGKLRDCIEKMGMQNHNLECPNCPLCDAIDKALAETAPEEGK